MKDGLRPFAVLQLKATLTGIMEAEARATYNVRNDLIWHAIVFARIAGYEVGIRIDPLQPEWPVVFIELPNGQISWHMPQHVHLWDNHTTEQKWERIEEFCRKEIP